MSTKSRKPDEQHDPPMPAEGGSWLRQPDGSLVRAPAEPPAMPASDTDQEGDS